MKTSCQLWFIVIQSFSQSVRTQVGQNSWTCDDPKFQCSPKQFHTKRRDVVPTCMYRTHIPRAAERLWRANRVKKHVFESYIA